MKLSVRTLLALAATVAVIGAGSASAAPSGAGCALVKDPAGDSGLSTSSPGVVKDDALDFTYVNLASDKTKLTGVFGLTKAAASAMTAPNGYQLLLNFTVPGFENEVYLNASGTTRTGVTFNFGQTDPTLGLDTLGAATGVVDTVKNEIRVTAKLADLKGGGINIKPGMKLSNINAISSRDLVIFIVYADRATGGKDYVAGSKSCVAVGK